MSSIYPHLKNWRESGPPMWAEAYCEFIDAGFEPNIAVMLALCEAIEGLKDSLECRSEEIVTAINYVADSREAQ